MEVKYITVDNVLKEKMRKMEIYNKIYEWMSTEFIEENIK